MLCVTKVIPWDTQVVGQADPVKLLRMTNTSTAIVRMYGCFFMISVVLNWE